VGKIEELSSIDKNKSITESVELMQTVLAQTVNNRQLDLILILASMVQKHDTTFTTYLISFDTLAQLYNPANPRTAITQKYIREAVENIMDAKFSLKNGSREKYFHWVGTCEIDWKKKTVQIALSEEVRKFYLLIKERTLTYNIKNMLALRTTVQKRLYVWAYGKKGFHNDVPISIEDAKLLFYGEKPIRTADFFRKCLDPAIQKVNEKTDLQLSYEKVYKDPDNKKRISSLKFKISCDYEKKKKECTASQIQYDREKSKKLWQAYNDVQKENDTLRFANEELKKECKQEKTRADKAENALDLYHDKKIMNDYEDRKWGELYG